MINVCDETHPVQAKYKSWLKFLLTTNKTLFLDELKKYPQLFAKYNSFDEATKGKFFEDFLEADAAVLKSLDGEVDLISVWSEVKYLKDAKKDIAFLQALKKIKNSNLSKHLKGEINAQNQAVGCHLQSAVDNVRVKIINPPTPIYNGLELVKAKLEIDGVVKSKFSDFFPSSWDETRVFEEAALILKNPANQLPNNVRIFKGTASDGITKIQVELTGADPNNLQINTVFPY